MLGPFKNHSSFLMKCPHCKYDNPDDAIFCCRCGNTLSGESLAISITEAAQIIGVTSQTVLNLIDRGCLVQMDSGDHRKTYISRKSVIDFVDVYPDFKNSLREIRKLKKEHSSQSKKLEATVAEGNSKLLCATLPEYDMVFRDICKSILRNREYAIIYEYYYNGKSFNQIGEELDLTPKRVRQIKEMALRTISDRFQHDDYITLENLIENEERIKQAVKLDKQRIEELEGLLSKAGIGYEKDGSLIDNLKLSPLIKQGLGIAGIYYVQQLVSLTSDEVKHLPYIGHYGVEEITQMLESLGLKLREDTFDADDEDFAEEYHEDEGYE